MHQIQFVYRKQDYPLKNIFIIMNFNHGIIYTGGVKLNSKIISHEQQFKFKHVISVK